jgi:hypothetical protein
VQFALSVLSIEVTAAIIAELTDISTSAIIVGESRWDSSGRVLIDETTNQLIDRILAEPDWEHVDLA